MARKTRADWIAFFARFEASGRSLSEYCSMRDVPYQTAKNWATTLRKAGEYPPANASAGLTSESGTESGTGTGAGSGAGTGTGTGGAKGKLAGKGGKAGASKSRTPGKATKPAGGGEKPARRCTPAQLANLRPPFEKGNRAAVKHGAYSKYLPPDIMELVEGESGRDLRSVIDEIKLTKGRLLMLQQLRAEWDAKAEYNELTHDDYVLTDIEVGPEGEKTKRKRPDFEAQEDRLTRTLAWLVQVQEQLQRETWLSADDKIAWRRQIIDDGEAAGWTYARIGLEIERHGLEVPMTLMALIRQELEQPPVDTSSTGFSDEELDALSARYEQEMAQDGEWLEQRKAEVGTIHAGHDASKVAG